jgi:truncated hemoglobin YjbI
MTLYEDLGGAPALRRLSDAFYERVLADELLAPVFASFTPTHVERVAVWLGEIFGGPADFTATLGGHQALLKVHLGLGIREEHRQRWLELMQAAIEEVLAGFAPAKQALALEIARLPEQIKGFGHVKARNLAAVRGQWDNLMARWRAA